MSQIPGPGNYTDGTYAIDPDSMLYTKTPGVYIRPFEKRKIACSYNQYSGNFLGVRNSHPVDKNLI
jgi:hypothetical protein